MLLFGILVAFTSATICSTVRAVYPKAWARHPYPCKLPSRAEPKNHVSYRGSFRCFLRGIFSRLARPSPLWPGCPVLPCPRRFDCFRAGARFFTLPGVGGPRSPPAPVAWFRRTVLAVSPPVLPVIFFPLQALQLLPLLCSPLVCPMHLSPFPRAFHRALNPFRSLLLS